MRNTIAAVLLFATGVAHAASVPNTFTAGSPARASEVNANFAALVTAVTTLENKVAALEAANGPLTTADVVGSYRLLGITSEAGGSEATRRIMAGAAGLEGTITFNANLTFTGTITDRGNRVSGKAQSCSSGGAATDASVAGTAQDSSHAHGYQRTLCNQDADAISLDDAADDSLNQVAGGSWSINASASTVTVDPSQGEPLTFHVSKRAGIAFAMEREEINDPQNPGACLHAERAGPAVAGFQVEAVLAAIFG